MKQLELMQRVPQIRLGVVTEDAAGGDDSGGHDAVDPAAGLRPVPCQKEAGDWRLMGSNPGLTRASYKNDLELPDSYHVLHGGK